MIPTATRHPALRALAALPALLLLFGLLAGAVHRHADGGAHACAVCAIGHASAIAAAPAPALAPTRPCARVPALAAWAPGPRIAPAAASRAPPTS